MLPHLPPTWRTTEVGGLPLGRIVCAAAMQGCRDDKYARIREAALGLLLVLLRGGARARRHAQTAAHLRTGHWRPGASPLLPADLAAIRDMAQALRRDGIPAVAFAAQRLLAACDSAAPT